MKVFIAIMLLCSATFAKNIELTEANHVLIRNEINDSSVSKAQMELSKKVVQRGIKNYTIYLVLDSPGGSISSGLDFIEFTKTIPNLETVTLFAASMASAIVEALPGRRNITATGALMFHRAAGGVSGQFESGELESRLEFYKKMVRGMEQTNADRLGISLESYKSKVVNELWILGSDSVKNRAADEIVTISCSPAVIAERTIESFEFMGINIDVAFSACPLIKMGQVVVPKQEAQYNRYKKEKLNMRIQ
jgi:ATP-dependent protease ClpP protease subunit